MKTKVPLYVAVAAAQATYVLTDTNVPSAPKFPLPRDHTLSDAYINTRSMLVQIVRNTFADSSIEHENPRNVEEDQEHMRMFGVLCLGILQNLSQQNLTKRARLEAETAEFNALALKVLTAGLQNLHLIADADRLLKACDALSSLKATISVEAASTSEHRQLLDIIEKRWTRLRLTLEILGELSAELDDIVEAGLLGGEEYEEWHGMSSTKSNGGDMINDYIPQVGAHDVQEGPSLAIYNPHRPEMQNPVSLTAEALSVFSYLPGLLLGLARPTHISLSMSCANHSPSSVEASAGNTLISTQIEPELSDSHLQYHRTRYIPNLTEIVSLIHSRALECLNNLFITIGRSKSVQDASQVKDSMILDSGQDLVEEDCMKEEDNMEAEEEDEALPIDMNGNHLQVNLPSQEDALAGYISANLPALQQIWEGLFQLLVVYMDLFQNKVRQKALSRATSQQMNEDHNGKGKKKASPSDVNLGHGSHDEACMLCIEAALGSIWTLGRLSVDKLVGVILVSFRMYTKFASYRF